MSERSALITGASSGIGLAIAQMLGEEGYQLTICGRRAEKLETAATSLRERGFRVDTAVGNLSDEEAIKRIVAGHGERHGRLDVLVNNAGLGTVAPLADIQTRHIDLQLAVNLRSVVLFYREALALLRVAAAEHRNALVVNTASIGGIVVAEPGVSVYGATKAAVINFTAAMNQELSTEGIKSTALCPGLVATPMTQFADGDRTEMISPEEIAVVVRALLLLSPNCLIPEIRFERPGAKV